MTMRIMAVLLQLLVSVASREQFEELDARVGEAMDAAGGPPGGLMAHVVTPDGDGFVVVEVWRTEAEGLSYLDDVLRGLLAEMGLTAGEVMVRPVWSFARP